MRHPQRFALISARNRRHHDLDFAIVRHAIDVRPHFHLLPSRQRRPNSVSLPRREHESPTPFFSRPPPEGLVLAGVRQVGATTPRCTARDVIEQHACRAAFHHRLLVRFARK